jgi:hypothetical protein
VLTALVLLALVEWAAKLVLWVLTALVDPSTTVLHVAPSRPRQAPTPRLLLLVVSDCRLMLVATVHCKL